jgi:uncharacterized protein YfiM (DUF2279 family)
MDSILQVAVLLAALGGPADGAVAPADALMLMSRPLPAAMQAPSDPWTSEDKFRHAAASWAAMVFTFAAVRSVHDQPDTALAIAVPVTAAFGIAKEIVDHRHGGPFSFRDLAADALGAGVAWLFLREVH